jgi:hypothetical protein
MVGSAFVNGARLNQSSAARLKHRVARNSKTISYARLVANLVKSWISVSRRGAVKKSNRKKNKIAANLPGGPRNSRPHSASGTSQSTLKRLAHFAVV